MMASNPLQAYNIIRDLLKQGNSSNHSSPHLPLLLSQLANLLPLIQQEIHNPNLFFRSAFTTGNIVGERYSDTRLMTARAQEQHTHTNTSRSYPRVVHCTTPTLSDEQFTNNNIMQEHTLLHIKTADQKCANSINSTTPFVVLLPWGGSKRRQYWPVVDHYVNTLNVDVVELNMPMVALSHVRVNLIFALYQYLSDIMTSENNNSTFFVHSFSMNGAWTNARLQIIDQLTSGARGFAEGNMFSRCQCIINDSCPVGASSSSEEEEDPATERVQMLLGSSRAYMPGIMGKVTYSNPKLANIYVIGVLTSICNEYFKANNSKNKDHHHQDTILDMYDTSLTEQMLTNFPKTYCNVPILFMYSNGDRLIPYKGIEMAAKIMKENGSLRIEKHMFNESPHCMHFRRHQKEYCFVLNQFFDEIGLMNSLSRL